MTAPTERAATPPRPMPRAGRPKRGRRLVGAVAALALVGGLTAGTSAAQEIPDVPPLGFEIDPVEGEVGSTVGGTVDTDDIAEHCVTDPAELVDGLLNGLGPAYEAYVESVAEGDLDPSQPLDYTRFLVILTILGLAGDPTLASDALGSTFVMAFADLATASPIAPFGTFDPVTGQGATIVPDLPPGTHPVIATCVGLPEEYPDEALARAEQAGLAYLEANIAQPFPQDFFADDSEFAVVAAEVFPVILQELVEPRALGIAFYCVADETGACPSGEEPPPGGGPGEEPPPPSTPGGGGGPDGDDDVAGGGTNAPPARPVSGQPDFTG